MMTLHKALILIVLNDRLVYWCDYAMQTITELSKKNTVIVFCSEDTISWKDILFKKKPVSFFEHKWNALLFHPFFIIPGQRFLSIKIINYKLNAWFLSWYLRKYNEQNKKIFWFFDPLYIPSILPFFADFLSVYDCVDYYDSVSSTLRKQDLFLLKTATYVCVNSKTLARLFRPHRALIHVVPLGFAKDVFQKYSTTIRKEKRVTVGFVGGITRRIDYPLITAVAKRLPDIQFVLYGALRTDAQVQEKRLRPEIEAFFQLPNVHWKGAMSKNDMPRIISSFDMCMIPYDTEDLFNRYCFPMKVMEYFFVGKPVIATPIEELKHYPRFVYIGKTAQSWVHHIRHLAGMKWSKQLQQEQKIIALHNSWDKKVSKITELLDEENRF